MKILKSQRVLPIPEGVDVTLKARKFTVKGPRGVLTRDFTHVPRVDMVHDKESNTVISHMSNCFDGVTKGFRYKMRAVYAHFPVNLNIGNKGEKIEIRNFLGEKRIRTCVMQEGVTIKRDDAVKDCLVLEGNDIDNVSKSAALIHMSCLVKKKDIRKFLDGFYVSEKGVISDE
jgi:large subunit ribosomal protein L9e